MDALSLYFTLFFYENRYTYHTKLRHDTFLSYVFTAHSRNGFAVIEEVDFLANL
jgi:hypothetical protein